MPSTFSILEQIQEHVRDALRGTSGLAAGAIIMRERGDIESQINEALNRLGMSIVVLPPVPTDVDPNVPGPYFKTIQVQIHCVSIPTTNSTGLSALEAAEEVLKALHHRNFKLFDGQSSLLVAGNNAIEPIDETEGVDFVIVNLTTAAGLKARNC